MKFDLFLNMQGMGLLVMPGLGIKELRNINRMYRDYHTPSKRRRSTKPAIIAVKHPMPMLIPLGKVSILSYQVSEGEQTQETKQESGGVQH